MKPGDIIKVKLGHDVHEAEVVKENPKTVLVKVLWSKTKYRKVKTSKIAGELFGMGQMSLFDDPLNVGGSVKVPYTARGKKIIKIPKAKIVSDKQTTDTKGTIHVPSPVVKPESPTTPAPQETVDEEVLVPPEVRVGKDTHEMMDYEAATDLEGERLEKVVEGVREVFTEHGKTMQVGVVELDGDGPTMEKPEPEYEGPGLGKDEAPLLVPKSVSKRLAIQTAKPDLFADLEAAIKKKGGK